MGVSQFMLGRELPSTVLDLLGIRLMPLAGKAHDRLVEQVELGRAYPDVLYRLGLSHLARQELGAARRRLEEAVGQKRDYVPALLALAAVCDLLALHQEAVNYLETALQAEEKAKVSRYQLLCALG